MENKVIEVLEYLSEKLGIAVDWTSQNVVPQVMEVLERYRTFEIWNWSIWLGVWVITLIISIYIGKELIGEYISCKNKKEDNFLWETYYSGIDCTAFGVIAIIVGVLTLIGGIMGSCICSAQLLRWIFIPELEYINLLNTMIGG